jgi:phosphate transport system substrate-binding protein
MEGPRFSRRAMLGGLALAPFAARAAVPAGEFTILGYNDMAEMIAGLDAAFALLHPGIVFHTELEGTRFGPAALAEGRALIAPMGALFTPAQLQAYRAVAGSEPAAFRIAHASLSPRALSGPNAIYVHRDNPLQAADLPAVAGLFTRPGPHRWRALGAGVPLADRPIRLAGLSPDTPLALEMQAAAFPGRAFAADMQGFRQSRDVIAFVAAEPLALGFAALNRASGPVRALGLRPRPGAPAVFADEKSLRAGAYPLDRHLWLYARRDARGRLDPRARAYIAFALSDRGQEIVGAGSLGYLPLGREEARRERAKLAR